MTAPTREQLADLLDLLGSQQKPAAPDLTLHVAAYAGAAIRQGGPGSPRWADTVRRLVDGIPAVLRRLYDAETSLATLRRTVAEHIYASNEGDDVSESDLAWELERAGVSVRADLDVVDALRTAEYAAQTRA